MASIDHQVVTTWRGGSVETLRLPSSDVEIMPGVRWGKFEEFFTPAFWVSRAWIDGESSSFLDYSVGRSLREEVAACLLGGHGMPAEVGLAAFRRLRYRSMLNGRASDEGIEAALVEPLEVKGRKVRYRYPHAKAGYVAAAMRRLNKEAAPMGSGKELRDWLMTFRGVGPKTASWITRNALHADDVAILDVHVIRAGLLMGLFSPRFSLDRDYFNMEARLVQFAKAISLRLSSFDSMIWCYMRRWNRIALDALSGKSGKEVK